MTVSSVGRVVHNYTVEGSEESELLRRFYQPFVAGMQRLDALSSSPETYRMTDEEIRRIESEYWAEYRRIKHEQIKFIVEHKSSLAGVYALYQRLPGETYLFNLDGDVIYYRMVAEAIEERYPESSYLPLLASEIARMDARQNLMSNIAETNFPDVELPDMFGRKVRLSSLQGKVVLVDFWSAELGNSNAINAELKEVYAEYADRGFEIYQIGVDVSKDIWINAVQEQQLPWISVCDFRGRNSPALGLYNVQKLPANFLIDREGIVVARDLYGTGCNGRSKRNSNRLCITSHRTFIWAREGRLRPVRSRNVSWRGSTKFPAMPMRSLFWATFSISGSNTNGSFPKGLCAYWESCAN